MNSLNTLTRSFSRQFLLIGSAVLVLSLAAQLSIPLQPVPLTFQSCTVVLLGLMLGSRNALYATSTYLLLGVCGLPIFANFFSGLPILLGPTGGYLLGFVPAAGLAGYLAEKGWINKLTTCFSAALLSTGVIFAAGVCGLATIIGWHAAIQLGLLPFVMSEPIKLIAITLFARRFGHTAK